MIIKLLYFLYGKERNFKFITNISTCFKHEPILKAEHVKVKFLLILIIFLLNLQITFKTKIYHPNIDEKGQVCLPIISPENWKPATKTDQGKICDIIVQIKNFFVQTNMKKSSTVIINNTFFLWLTLKTLSQIISLVDSFFLKVLFLF